ncbi:hypothetical protein OSB04_030592 [Centaurea solstitialis]|uniref:Uncharacterized protein n=1 Tax=Centaurea solstitialis TaxID=347529 RepID=A0AA38W552_9ASTR|nr:hypothetical protein OSB04_030592 [Centaurea solstitialis]
MIQETPDSGTMIQETPDSGTMIQETPDSGTMIQETSDSGTMIQETPLELTGNQLFTYSIQTIHQTHGVQHQIFSYWLHKDTVLSLISEELNRISSSTESPVEKNLSLKSRNAWKPCQTGDRCEKNNPHPEIISLGENPCEFPQNRTLKQWSERLSNLEIEEKWLLSIQECKKKRAFCRFCRFCRAFGLPESDPSRWAEMRDSKRSSRYR